MSAAEFIAGPITSTLRSGFDPDPHEVRSLRTKVRCHMGVGTGLGTGLGRGAGVGTGPVAGGSGCRDWAGQGAGQGGRECCKS